MGALSKVLVLVVFVLGGGAAALLYGGGAKPAPPPAEPPVRLVGVRVAEVDLVVGTFFDPAAAPFVQTPEHEVRDDWLVAGGPDLSGAVVIGAVPRGQPVPRGALLTPGQEGFLAAVLTPGARAVSVGVDAVSGNAGLIFPGDRVDVLLTQRIDDSARTGDLALSWGSETILRNVRVIAVDQNLKTDLAARDASAVARTITLEVSPAEAEIVAVARNLGALSMTLRSLVREGEADAPAVEAPTWAGDVSAVIRAATGRGGPVGGPAPGPAPATDRAVPPPPAIEAAAEPAAAPAAAPAQARRVTVMRGAATDEVQEATQ
jgi:pilus assembly protein CpaB